MNSTKTQIRGTAMAFITLAEKGRIVIPAKLRKKYGMKIGDKYQVKDDNGNIVIIPEPVTNNTATWTKSWTRKMETALKDVEEGRVSKAYDNLEEALRDLKKKV
jgi:AbrB family looped-hinge helix DNA binding protein